MMTRPDIQRIVDAALPFPKNEGDLRKKKTVSGTVHIGALTGNRLNSGTLRSQFIVCETEEMWRRSDARRALHSDQLAFVQVDDDKWDVYKGACLDSESSEPIRIEKAVAGLGHLLKFDDGKSDPTPSPSLRTATFSRPDILAAIRSKPFILLAGMSGTGKTRIVRQLARGFCPAEGELADDPLCPGNYACIPVRPDWHDSTGLMGYVTRITDDGRPRYVSTDFIRFLAKAWLYEDEAVPFFLCLDEMNLAPVEQYFAEYLSVVESRQVDTARGRIATDPLVRVADKELLRALVDEVYREDKHERVERLKAFFLSRGGIPIPSNFVVMGTVNMDETTCSFSRKVLDRAMTFEFNEFDIDEGLASNPDIAFGSLQPTDAQCRFTHGWQVYAAAHDVCDWLKPYLTAVNKALDGTKFKFAYRSRDEIMFYCVERTRDGTPLATAADEATCMKILSRIEGDEQEVGKTWLEGVAEAVREGLQTLAGANAPEAKISTNKLKEMSARLERTGFTSFWQ